ncbi:MAG: hypothetical protein ACRC62_31290 [Microcoleus sp.]
MKEEGRRKKEEGRRKREEGVIQNFQSTQSKIAGLRYNAGDLVRELNSPEKSSFPPPTVNLYAVNFVVHRCKMVD